MTLPLTTRQRQIVELAREGLTYKQMGARLALSPETVRAHVKKIAARNGRERAPLRWLIAHASRLLAA